MSGFSDPKQTGFIVNSSTGRFIELWTAYEERRACAIYSGRPYDAYPPDPLPTFGACVFPDVFKQMQLGILEMVPVFVNPEIHTASTPGDFTYNSWANFCSAIGFPGFRRVVNYDGGSSPDFIYPISPDPGIAQKGDVLGWWIWEDIVKVFNHMQATVVIIDPFSVKAADVKLVDSSGEPVVFGPQVLADLVAQVNAVWNSTPFSHITLGYYQYPNIFLELFSSNDSSFKYAGLLVAHNIVYGLPALPSIGTNHPTFDLAQFFSNQFGDYSTGLFSYVYWDPEGRPENLVGNSTNPIIPVSPPFSDTQDWDLTIHPFDGYDGNPLEDSGILSAPRGYDWISTVYACKCSPTLIIHWDFTN